MRFFRFFRMAIGLLVIWGALEFGRPDPQGFPVALVALANLGFALMLIAGALMFCWGLYVPGSGEARASSKSAAPEDKGNDT